MRSAIWEYLRGTFAFPQQCPPASLSTLYCSLHFTPAALIGSLHFHCFIFFLHRRRRYQKRKPTMSSIMKALLLFAVLVCVSRAQRKFLFSSFFFKWQNFILTCLSFSSGWQERSLTSKPCSLLSSLQSLHQRNAFAEGPGGWGACRLK